MILLSIHGKNVLPQFYFNWWNFSTLDPIPKFFIAQLSNILQLVKHHPVVELYPVKLYPVELYPVEDLPC